jgi:dipeptidyl aminopeptidase/acylaminoacyl peptidase
VTFRNPILSAALLGIVFATPPHFAAETPEGLLTLSPEEIAPARERNWKRLGIPSSDITVLDRFHRGGGYEGFHIAYKLGDLHLTGILTRPYIRDEQTKFPLIILNHGGSRGISGPYRAIALDLARRGYMVLATSFRGQGGIEGRSEGRREYAKGEVLDVLQLTQMARKQPYADSLRMAIVGEDHGATVSLLAIQRSNVFRAAVAISPDIFSAQPQYGLAGRNRLSEIWRELYGSDLSQAQTVRELAARDVFRTVQRIKTPVMLVTGSSDPAYDDQAKFVAAVRRVGTEARFLEFPGMFRGFMTAYDNGARPAKWKESRESAWTQVFEFLAEKLPEPEPKPEPSATR